MTQLANELNYRRKMLGMTYKKVAKRSGVSLPTVVRLLTGSGGATFENVVAVAEALGVCIEFKERISIEDLCEQQAEKVANRVIGLLQGTSGLEGQALPVEEAHKMKKQTVRELMAGSRKRLWKI